MSGKDISMIEIKNLTKRYGTLTAVDDLTFTIEKGKIYGLLGANGAGKTTTMNMIAGALAPSSGSITVCGSDLATDPVSAKKHIGYLPEIPPLYTDLTVREYLTFVADAKGISGSPLRRAVSSVMKQTSLTETADRLIRNLSKGYCQRIGIAQAMLGDPEILILDEPTVGLDPRQIVEIRELIRSLTKTHTVILSSHILSEVAELCDTIMILSSGKLVAADTLVNLQKEYLGNDKLHLSVKCALKKCEELLGTISGVEKFEATANGSLTQVTIECTKGNDIREAVFFAFAAIRCPIVEMQLEKASLEQVFLSATTTADPQNSDLSKQAALPSPIGRRNSPLSAQPNHRASQAPSGRSDPKTPKVIEEEDDDDYIPLFSRKEKRK